MTASGPPDPPDPIPTIEWFGCATFRVRIGAATLWFDTYVDRVPAAEPVGITSDDIDEASFVFISHAHFDHILGADTVAARTGAVVVGSYESARVLRGVGVPDGQILPVSGGEAVDCGGGVRVRVFPSLHSCLWASAPGRADESCCGDLGVSAQARREQTSAIMDLLDGLDGDIAAATSAMAHRVSRDDGGQLVFLLESPHGSLLVSASSGYWSGIFADLHPDVAVLAAAGRPNLDGEPYQGSLADFVTGQVRLLEPQRVILCHHDAWMPPLPAVDVAPIAAALAAAAPATELITLGYGRPVPLFAPSPPT